MGLVFSSLYSGAFKKQILMGKEDALRHVARSVEVVMKGADKSAVALSMDLRLEEMIAAFRGNDRKNLPLLVAKLRETKNTSRYLTSVYLYLQEEEEILTSEDGHWAMEDFYDQACFNELPSDKSVFSSSLRQVVDHTGIKNHLFSVYAHLGRGSGKKPDYIVINVSGEDLSSMLLGANQIAGEYTVILDERGMILCGTDESSLLRSYTDVGSEKNLSVTAPCKYSNWILVNAFPASYVTQTILSSTGWSILLGLLFIAVGLILIRSLAGGICRPINEAVAMLRGKNCEFDRTQGSYRILSEDLKTMISQMLEQHKSLTEMNMSSKEILRSDFLRNLLMGRYSEESPALHYAASLDLHLEGPYRLFIAALDHESFRNGPFRVSDKSMALYGAQNVISELLAGHGELVRGIVEDAHGVFLISGRQDEASVERLLEEVREKMKALMLVSVTFSISSAFPLLKEAPIAYGKCKGLLEHRLELGGGVLTEAALLRRPVVEMDSVLFLQEQLVTQTRQENESGAIAVIDRLVRAIHGKQVAYPENLYLILSNLLSDFFQIKLEKGYAPAVVSGNIRVMYQEMLSLDTITEIGEWLKKTVAYIMEIEEPKKEFKNEELFQKIFVYLDEHFAEDLHLSTLAEQVYLSPTYLSRLFKQQTGRSFVEYLTDIRIREAKKRLSDPTLKIAEIAEETKFGTANNFIRIFKKYEGLTPGQYRQNIAMKGLAKEENGVET